MNKEDKKIELARLNYDEADSSLEFIMLFLLTIIVSLDTLIEYIPSFAINLALIAGTVSTVVGFIRWKIRKRELHNLLKEK